MADYKESTVTGSKWRRVYEFQGKNPLGASPSLILFQQDVVTLDDGTIVKSNAPSISVRFDPTNPKHMAIYNAINEVYIEERERIDSLILNNTGG